MKKQTWAATAALSTILLTGGALMPATATTPQAANLTYTFMWAEGTGCDDYQASGNVERAYFLTPELDAIISSDTQKISKECTGHWTVTNHSDRTVGSAVETSYEYDMTNTGDRLSFNWKITIDDRVEGTDNRTVPSAIAKARRVPVERNVRIPPGEHHMAVTIGVGAERNRANQETTSQIFVHHTSMRNTDTL